MWVTILPFILDMCIQIYSEIGDANNSQPNILDLFRNFFLMNIVQFKNENMLANVTINEDGWSMYNPHNLEFEYTLEIALNTSLTNVTKESDNYCRMAVGDLKCRPKRDNILDCYFTNGKGYVNTGEKCTYEDSYYPEFELFRNSDPFKVRYNSNGIKDLIVSEETTNSKLDKIKAVLRQLEIGIRASDNGLVLNTTYAPCEYFIRSAHDALQEDDHSTEGQNFQLVIGSSRNPKNHYYPQDILRVVKAKDVHNCPPTYIFGNMISQIYNDTELRVNTTFSMMEIKISKNEFKSTAITEAVMYTPTSRIMPIMQELSVELKRIDLMTYPLPTIYKPMVVSRNVSSDLENTPTNTFFLAKNT